MNSKQNIYTVVDSLFLQKFPEGLLDANWLELGKKHKSSLKIVEMLNEDLGKKLFKKHLDNKDYKYLIEKVTSVVQKSTTISVFEKIAFKNFIAQDNIHEYFLHNLYNFLHVDYKKYFSDFVGVLASLKDFKNANAAKWTVVTLFLSHAYPDVHVFIKPTTVKAMASFFSKDIAYKSIPNLNTYEKVREMVLDFKKNSSLTKEQNNIITQAIIFCAVEKNF